MARGESHPSQKIFALTTRVVLMWMGWLLYRVLFAVGSLPSVVYLMTASAGVPSGIDRVSSMLRDFDSTLPGSLKRGSGRMSDVVRPQLGPFGVGVSR